MPASRSARAMTLAPRSWPSRPAFATRMRIGRAMLLDERRFAIAAEDRHERFRDLAQRRFALDALEIVRHEIFVSFGSALEGGKRRLDLRTVARGAERFDALALLDLDRAIDLEQRYRMLFFYHEIVDTADNAIAVLKLALIRIRGIG